MLDFPYPLVYSKRRSVSIIIKHGKVEVRAPQRANLAQIKKFVSSKQGWIDKALARHRQRQIPEKKFTEGEQLLFLGKNYPLRISENYFSRLRMEQGIFLLSKFRQRSAKSQFEDWYRRRAKEFLTERCQYYGRLMNVKYQKITITGAATRWGSCSRKGTINFSWKLALAPPEIVDYVAVHELAHLRHHNHSKEFWRFVAMYFPNFRMAKKWLNQSGHLLAI
ncbi:MAG: M48 family metallopeptidase [Patescibacteria group bacterium]|nr:M48 family metallopeptidase [Patescibacteria group bacterium]